MFEKNIEKLNDSITNWAYAILPWTNVYGLARSIMAISTALTLALNDASIFFRPGGGFSTPNCSTNIPAVFCLVPNNYIYLNLVRWICVIILLIVASGWRPRITGIFHWWISYSLQVSALTIDGGEQVSAVFTLLLLPIALTDPRKWHWESYKQHEPTLDKRHLYLRVIALVTFLAIRLQVAILYFNSFVSKLADQDWVNGTAVYYYAQHLMLGFPPILMDMFDFVLTSKLVVIPTWGTLLIQFLLFAALFSSKKYWNAIFLAALFMHELFAVMFGLISFSMIMCAILILYLRPIEKEFKFNLVKRLFNKTWFPFKRGDAKKTA